MKNSGEMNTGLLFKISVWDSSVLQLVSGMPGSKSEAGVVPRCLEATERTVFYKRENGKVWCHVCQKERCYMELRNISSDSFMFGGGIVPLWKGECELIGALMLQPHRGPLLHRGPQQVPRLGPGWARRAEETMNRRDWSSRCVQDSPVADLCLTELSAALFFQYCRMSGSGRWKKTFWISSFKIT